MGQPPEVDEFLTSALSQRDFERCERLIGQLQARAEAWPALGQWARYLRAIMLNERDRDLGASERVLRELALEVQEPELECRVALALGVTLEIGGRWGEALAAHRQALDLFSRLGREDDRARALKQIAIAYNEGYNHAIFGAAELDLALTACRQAQAILDPLPGDDPGLAELRGTIWNTLGLIYRNLGRLDEAEDCYRRDLELLALAASGGELNDYSVAVTRLNLGEIHQLRGPGGWPAARRLYRQAREGFRKHEDLGLEIDALANLGALEQEAGDLQLALRHYLRAARLIELLRAGVSAEEARAGFFSTMVNVFANAVLICWELGETARAFALAEQSRARAFLDALAARSGEPPRAFRRPTLALAAVQARLAPDELLLSSFTTGQTELHERRAARGLPPRHRYPPERILLFAVTADRAELHLAPGLSPNSLRPGRLDSPVERHLLRPELRRTLYEALVGPVEHLVRGRRTVYITPHGALHYVPFHALLAGDGETALREGGPSFVYGPSATLLFARPRQARRAGRPALAVGFNGLPTGRLRYAEEEARSVAGRLGGDALVGPGPKKEQLLASAQRYRILHLCCHGSFQGEVPLSSALQLGPAETLRADEVLGGLRIACDLVTLSACESGLSRVRYGDELYGLARAFLRAGARAVLCTLWRVDDRSTRLLMGRFYDELLAGASFAEALGRAQRFLRRLTRAEADALLASDHGAAGASAEVGAVAPPAGPGWLDEAGGGDGLPFAEPFHWAPFILIGHDARLS